MPRARTVLYSLLGLNLFLRVLVAIRPLRYIDGLTVPDDAYLAMTLAKNIATGHGPLYGHEFTNGFQPLYVFLIAPIYRFFSNDLFTPVHIALLISILFDTATLYIVFRLAQRICRDSATPIIAALAWILNPYSIYTATNGLETSLSLFMIVLTYYFYIRFLDQRLEKVKPMTLLAFGVILGLAMLTRIDNIFLATVFTAAIMYVGIRRFRAPLQPLRDLLLIGAAVILICLPWMIYAHHYTGDLIPVSGKAVRYLSLAASDHHPTISNTYLPTLMLAAATIAKHNLAYWALLFGLVLTVILLKPRIGFKSMLEKLKTHNIILAFIALLFLAYVFFVFGAWYFKRYFYPVSFLLLLYNITLIDIILIHLRAGRARRGFIIALVAFLTLTCALNPKFRDLYFSTNTTDLGHMNLGLWAKRTFPDSTVVGSCQTGALAYFADNLKVINLDGVVNRRAFTHLIRGEAIDYIKSERIEYFIDWPPNKDFIVRESRRFRPDDLTLIGQITEFTSWHHEWYIYKVNYPG
jgi:hypothetical protein